MNNKFIKKKNIDYNFYKIKKIISLKKNITFISKKYMYINTKNKINNTTKNTTNNTTNKNDIKIKFCCFVGRESNLVILHKYIEKIINLKIIDEYHMFDFTRNIIDSNFVLEEYNRLFKLFENKIFIYNHEENKEKIINNSIDNSKYDWSPFYKKISSKIFYNNSIIIKCDDDILFIDINGLKNAIVDRINDNYSFLIHSNCINNNVCSYYQRKSFIKIEKYLENYPEGGILGKIFEIPMMAYSMHNQFYSDLLGSIENINKYKIENTYVKSRISINFILMNGEDCKYFKNTKYDDEYELSSFYPEKLFRPNKIIGNFITSHYSYGLQEKVLNLKKEIKTNYNLLSKKYLNNFDRDNLIEYKIINLEKLNYKLVDNLIKIKNFLTSSDYYIKSKNLNKYLYIDYEDNNIKLSNKKTLFRIDEYSNNIITIKKGIYYFIKYNLLDQFKNKNILINFLGDLSEKKILKILENDNLYLKFFKSSLYLNINENKIFLSKEKKESWIFEKHNYHDNFLYMKRYEKNKKFYYENIKNNEVFTNFYLGWGNENIIF